MTIPSVRLFAAEAVCAGHVVAGGEPRADLAEALGRSEAGQRVTAVIDAARLPAVADLLQQAAERQLPLVVRTGRDDGHRGLFAVADTGAVVLLAATAAEVPLLHLLARVVAERALLPAIVVAAADEAEPAALPAAAAALLGDAGDLVPAATPSQELLFGKHRRRVVRWFDAERPVLRGQPADPALRQLQRAGAGPFVAAPVAALLQQAAADVQQATGRSWSPVTATGVDRAEVLAIGLADATAMVAAALAGNGPEPRLGAIALHCLRPLPTAWIDLLRKKRAAIVLGSADAALAAEPPLLRELRAALAAAVDAARAAGRPWKDKELPAWHLAIAGLGGARLAAADLAAFAAECRRGDGRPLVYLGVEFAPLQGELRKRTVLHEALRRAHPGIERLGLRAAPPAAVAAVPPAPLRAPLPAQLQATHDSATRCWDLVAGAAVAGAAAELAPDPYLTAGSAPALTSLFRGNAAAAMLPALDPVRCTGCGRCWSLCPDAALLPCALPAGELLEAGMRRAQAQGQPAEALRPVFGRLQKALPQSLAQGALHAGAAVRHAAGAALAKLDADRRPPLQEAAELLARNLDQLPLVLTEPLFTAVEQQRPGSGELLALALDADACKGCGLCVAVCAPQALQPGERSNDAVQAHRAAAAAWRELPDTAGATIAAARKLPEPGLLGAIELSRHCLLAVAPGDDSEPGGGARIAVRTALAAAEAHLQPLLQQQLGELDELADAYGKRIRELLGAALPATDLDALHEGLATLGGGAVALATLAARLDDVTAQGRVDTARLQRLVDTARALADLRWRLASGSNGRGRARAGLLLAGDGPRALASTFPWNPFAAPAVLDHGADAGHRAIGLLHGQAAALAHDFALLRSARAQLQQGPPAPRALGFADLQAGERALCPPLWLVADAALLRTAGLAQLATVLGSGLPIKLLLLQQAPVDGSSAQPALLALAHRDAFVLQTSISAPDHFAAGVLDACRHPGPALLHVLAPSPRAHDAAADRALALAAEAVAAHAFPLFRYDPARAGAFGQKLSLAGNPVAAGSTAPTAAAAAAEMPPVWQLLQELAGEVTPFTREVEQRAAAAVAEAHRAELAALAAQHQQALQGAKAVTTDELLARLQRRLAQLAGGGRR